MSLRIVFVLISLLSLTRIGFVGVVFMISDAVFIIQLYRNATEHKLIIDEPNVESKSRNDMVEVAEEIYQSDESFDNSMLRRRMKF